MGEVEKMSVWQKAILLECFQKEVPQFNDVRIFDPQAPDEKPVQKSTKKINLCLGKALKKRLIV